MLTGIDHAVIVVPNLERAIASFRAHGFQVEPGGVHGGGASHNALLGFQDGSYLELFAVLDPAAPHPPHWRARLERGGGLADLALGAQEIEREVERLRAAGFAYPLPRAMSRRRPDGRELHWRLTSATSWPGAWLPFLIEDDTPRAWRVPGGSAAVHPNGVTGIAAVEIAIPDLALVDRLYRPLLGLPPDPASTARLRLDGAEFLFRLVPAGSEVGPVAVLLATPTQPVPAQVVIEQATFVFVPPSTA